MIAKMAGAKPKVAVIGAGPGGIAMGIQLADGGYDFTIFDRGEGFGGTWRNNTYPGAACDVPSHFYSYSFALNPRWSKTFANQPEILAYLEKVAADNHLGRHLVTCTPAVVGHRAQLAARDRGRCHATVPRRRHRGGHARCPQHPRHSRR
jgi:cation diffusion facilitator CzcD-associated flavoprotein CzcO